MVSQGWVKRLVKEVNIWVGEKIIDPAQAERITTRYSNVLQHNRFVSTVYVLGSILLGLGIILFIASNWQYLGKAFKVFLVFCFILGFNFLGYHLYFHRTNFNKLGESLLFLGAVAFGCGIWLIAQIFQIRYYYPNGLLFWILGIIPNVVLLRSKSILVLSSLLSPVWLIVSIGNNSADLFYPFLILQSGIFYLIYRERQKASLVISLLSMAIWFSHYLYVFLGNMGFDSIYIHLFYSNLFISYGFLLYCLGVWHNSFKNWGGFSFIYKLLALIFIFLNNYLLTFVHHYYYEGVHIRVPELKDSIIAVLSILCFYVFSGFIVYKFMALTKVEEEKKEAKIFLLFLIFQILGIYCGPLGIRGISFFYNILLFAEILGFLYLGYLLRAEYMFRLSLFVFAVDIFTRYFDTFWKILPRSVFFILGGFILISGGIFLEKKRRLVEKKMKENVAST